MTSHKSQTNIFCEVPQWPDGSIRGTASAEGRSVTLAFDRNGDKVVDDIQAHKTATKVSSL